MNKLSDFRTIAKRDLIEIGRLKRPMGYVDKRLSNSDFRFIFDVHIKRVRMSHGKRQFRHLWECI